MSAITTQAVVLFFIWLFSVAAWHKLVATAFYQSLVRTYLAPGLPVSIAMRGIAFVEVLAVALLLNAATRHFGLQLVILLLVCYGILMSWQLWRKPAGERARCGCTGPHSETRISPTLILRNLLCAALAFAALGDGVHTISGLPDW